MKTVRTSVLATSINFSGGLSDAWTSVARIVPKLLAFLVIMVIGWIVARVLAKVVDVLLRRIGFERAAEHAGVGRALANSKYDATAILAKVVYYGILLVALQLAFGVFGPNPISTMIQSVVAWLPKAFIALVIVVVAAAIARAVRDIVGGALEAVSYGRMLANLASIFIISLGVIAALGQADIATTITGPVLIAVLATIAGILIVGVGGGMVMPMRQRWDRWLDVAERESRNASTSMNAYRAGRGDALSGQPQPAPTAAPHSPMTGGATETGRTGTDPGRRPNL